MTTVSVPIASTTEQSARQRSSPWLSATTPSCAGCIRIRSSPDVLAKLCERLRREGVRERHGAQRPSVVLLCGCRRELVPTRRRWRRR